MGEGIEPGELHLDMILVHGKAQVEELELAVISIQQIPSRRAVLSGPSHVLPKSVERGTFFRVPLGVITIAGANVRLQRSDPIDFTRLLQRRRDHGGLCRGHVCDSEARSMFAMPTLTTVSDAEPSKFRQVDAGEEPVRVGDGDAWGLGCGVLRASPQLRSQGA